MADEKQPKEVKEPKVRLRTSDELSAAHEWLFDMQKNHKMDGKTADALNTTLKGAVYLNGKLKLDMLKLWMTAQIKKIDIPNGMLPE